VIHEQDISVYYIGGGSAAISHPIPKKRTKYTKYKSRIIIIYRRGAILLILIPRSYYVYTYPRGPLFHDRNQPLYTVGNLVVKWHGARQWMDPEVMRHTGVAVGLVKDTVYVQLN
jgi:hypothetical protein